MPFEFQKQEIPEIMLVTPKVFGDERGFFMETYKKSEFIENGITEDFVQDNHSSSTKNVIRGLHYQLNPNAQGKLVRCTKGEIFDIGVDLRKNSPTFGKWCGVKLTGENKKMLYIPAGFAHGFVTLSDIAEVLYKATEEYSANNDRSIRWNDETINIDWNIDNPIISEKDKKAPFLKDAEINFKYGV